MIVPQVHEDPKQLKLNNDEDKTSRVENDGNVWLDNTFEA